MVEAIITAPINKKAIQSKRFKFPGHTDFLEGKFEGKALMFMVSKDLRIALVTDHVPINSVSKMISSKRLIIKINQVLYSLKNDFGIVNPKIAVLGLNPHSGDDGVIGSEDDDILKPAISKSMDHLQLMVFLHQKNIKNMMLSLRCITIKVLFPLKL